MHVPDLPAFDPPPEPPDPPEPDLLDRGCPADLVRDGGHQEGCFADPPPAYREPLLRLGSAYRVLADALATALALSPAGALGRLELLASVELPVGSVAALPAEGAREVATRHGLVAEYVPERLSTSPEAYRFFGPAAGVAALLAEVARA